MDSIERIIRATPLPINLPNVGNGDSGSSSSGSGGNGQSAQRALVHASLATAVGRKGRHLTGTFCLTGDTMEGIIQCLVFLKAFSVSSSQHNFQPTHTPLWPSCPHTPRSYCTATATEQCQFHSVCVFSYFYNS